MDAKTGVPYVCSVWREQSYSTKNDSSLTVAEIKRGNAMRNAYCAAVAPATAD